MATGLPGSSLPLDPNIQQAIDDFSDPITKAQAIYAVARLVLLQDLRDEVERAIKDALGN